MLVKLLLVFPLFVSVWNYPIDLDENQFAEHGMISQEKVPRFQDILNIPEIIFVENGLIYTPTLDILEDPQEILKVQVHKHKAKPKVNHKPKPKANHKVHNIPKPKKHSPGKTSADIHYKNHHITGQVTWKHKGTTVHGEKNKKGWKISINHH